MLLNIHEAFHLFYRSSPVIQRYVTNLANEPNEPLALAPGAVRQASSMFSRETTASPTDTTCHFIESSYEYFSAPILVEFDGRASAVSGSSGNDWLRPIEDAVSSLSEMGSHHDFDDMSDVPVSSPSPPSLVSTPELHTTATAAPATVPPAVENGGEGPAAERLRHSVHTSRILVEHARSTPVRAQELVSNMGEKHNVNPAESPYVGPAHGASPQHALSDKKPPRSARQKIDPGARTSRTDLGRSSARPFLSTVPPPNYRRPRAGKSTDLGSCRMYPSEYRHNVMYGGILAAHVVQSSGCSRLLVGRSISDPVIGDMFAVMRQDAKTVLILSIRVVGLNRKDKWILTCNTELLKHIVELCDDSRILAHVRHASRHTLFRGCFLCGAPAQPNGCVCMLWTTGTDLLKYRETKRVLFETMFGGYYEGVTRFALRGSDGVLRKQPGLSRCHGMSLWTDNQGASIQNLLCLLLQNALIRIASAPAVASSEDTSPGPPGGRVTAGMEVCGAALLDEKAPDYPNSGKFQDVRRTGTSAIIRGSYTTDCPENAARVAAYDKERKAYERKLRNRDSALRSNAKRSQKYRKLMEDVKSRRDYIAGLNLKLVEVQEENSRLRFAACRGGSE